MAKSQKPISPVTVGPVHAKPPIGVKPRQLWLEDRQEALSGAINRYINSGCRTSPAVNEWISELMQVRIELASCRMVEDAMTCSFD